jgi:hypothetical protein
MGVPTGKYERTNEWEEFAYKSWRYVIHRPDSYYDDRILLGYDSFSKSWRIFINDHEVGCGYELDEAKALAAMLYKLQPERRFNATHKQTP